MTTERGFAAEPLRRFEPLPLECDGVTRALSMLLARDGIQHRGPGGDGRGMHLLSLVDRTRRRGDLRRAQNLKVASVEPYSLRHLDGCTYGCLSASSEAA